MAEEKDEKIRAKNSRKSDENSRKNFQKNDDNSRKKVGENDEKIHKNLAENSSRKNDNIAKKFADIVTKGTPEYRKKYAGLTEAEMSEMMTREMNEKIAQHEARREKRQREKDEIREQKLQEKMKKWRPEDRNKPIFLRRRNEDFDEENESDFREKWNAKWQDWRDGEDWRDHVLTGRDDKEKFRENVENSAENDAENRRENSPNGAQNWRENQQDFANQQRELQRARREDWREWQRERREFSRSLHSRHHTFWRVFWGLFFLVAALAVGAQIFGLFAISINVLWVVLMIFLVAILVASVVQLNWFLTFLPAAGILTIINSQTNLLHWPQNIYAGLFGVAILLSVAFTILFHRSRGREFREWQNYHHRNNKKNRDENATENFRENLADDGREVVVNARLGETVRYVNSKNLEQVWIDCKLGGAKVYFDNAVVANKELKIHIECSLGGLQMFVPKTWRIISGLNAMAGGVSEKGASDLSPDSPTVTLSGNANLGGVEIIYI